MDTISGSTSRCQPRPSLAGKAAAGDVGTYDYVDAKTFAVVDRRVVLVVDQTALTSRPWEDVSAATTLAKQ